MRYLCLKTQCFHKNNYSIVPIRSIDKYEIMQWRNEQIYHLRQNKLLTIKDQEYYFEKVVAKLFDQEKPNQILFSYLEGGVCIGYGGLVHINWIDKNAEISFIINTAFEKEHFEFHWITYLSLIEQVAFNELKLHKIFTFAFDLRPKLYQAVEKAGFKKEAVLTEHYLWDGQFINAVVHSKINHNINIRLACEKDLILYFDWANDEFVRKQSFQSDLIDLEKHKTWFESKIQDSNCSLLVFENDIGQAVGQVRIQRNLEGNALIGISIAKSFRGKKLATPILKLASAYYLEKHPKDIIFAYIKRENISSVQAFIGSGFIFDSDLHYQDIPSFLYKKTL